MLGFRRMSELTHNPNGGPNTIEGRAKSSMNSTKHGLTGKQVVMPGEDPEEFEALESALMEEHQPANITESMLVHDLAKFHWLKERAIRLQQQSFLTDLAMDEKHLALMIRYQTANQNAFHRTLKALQAVKKERLGPQKKFVSQTQQHAIFPKYGKDGRVIPGECDIYPKPEKSTDPPGKIA